jgi:uncharacterized protein YndB with AHSA1/START domain
VQRSIEILIGRLVTDEDFRTAFRDDPRAALVNAGGRGLELSAGEVGALLVTDHTLWDRVARELDSRLQKASLRVPAEPDHGPLEQHRHASTGSSRMTGLRARKQLVIDAPPEVVWNVHTDITAWSHWHRSISSASAPAHLTVGSEFTWKSGGLTIASTIQTLEPNRRISWTGRSLGTRATHTWLLQPHDDGTLVTTEESMQGWLVRLVMLVSPAFLDRSLDAWLVDLKTAVTAGPHTRTRPPRKEAEATRNDSLGHGRSA